MHPQNEEITIGSVRFNTHDLGGHAAARRLWRQYFANVDGIVFMVDSTAHDRFQEAKKELTLLLSDEQLKDTPFLILGNKIDSPNAVSETILKDALGIDHTTGKNATKPGNGRPIEVYMCSIYKRTGYAEGFRWLSNFL
jgi:GTP-binding protein SAR1